MAVKPEAATVHILENMACVQEMLNISLFFFFFNCNEYSRAPEAVLQLSEVQNGTVQFYLSPVLYGLKSSIVSSI